MYWPSLAQDIAEGVRQCVKCVSKIRKINERATVRATVHVPSDINDVLGNEVIIGAENGSEENGLENDQTADKAERNDEVIIGAENGSEENGLENDQTADEAEQNVEVDDAMVTVLTKEDEQTLRAIYKRQSGTMEGFSRKCVEIYERNQKCQHHLGQRLSEEGPSYQLGDELSVSLSVSENVVDARPSHQLGKLSVSENVADARPSHQLGKLSVCGETADVREMSGEASTKSYVEEKEHRLESPDYAPPDPGPPDPEPPDPDEVGERGIDQEGMELTQEGKEIIRKRDRSSSVEPGGQRQNKFTKPLQGEKRDLQGHDSSDPEPPRKETRPVRKKARQVALDRALAQKMQ